ncbi:MAG TPA: ATP synthase F1 subunit epsilon [Oculatellaceae cyanobacterium]|jgi:F-type H+-transporting ATPase subunit epsilon
MKLKIVTPERVVVEEDAVEAVYGKSTEGQIGILPKHVPLVTPLDIGVLHYVKAGQKQPLAVMGGLLKTDGESVIVMSDAAEKSSDIDAARAQSAKLRAEARLREKSENVDVQRAQRALARATVRLSLTQR